MDSILILDFGSQTTQLIARRIREIGVYTDIVPGDTPASELPLDGVKGLIFSGSPFSVYETDAPGVDSGIYSLGLPILGICYGFQRMTEDHGGKVSPLEKREFGRSRIEYRRSAPLFNDIPDGFTSWMSHGDSIEQPGEGFELIAQSEHHIAAAWNRDKQLYGIQFHPEVSHCENGVEILRNYVLEICGANAAWSMEAYLEQVSAEIRKRVGKERVLLLISGGVDSTVVGGLLLQALPHEQVYLMYIDTGLMRKDESVEVERTLRSLGAKNLSIIHAEEEFLSALAGIDDPEEKRRIIGDLFITVQAREVEKLSIGDAFLAQGTLYTDMIESGKGVGKKAKVIKSHHNVRSPLVEAKREAGRIIEPLDRLYKDEVRRLGTTLGIGDQIIRRHPFPGPGLAVRILGEITPEKCAILREADSIFMDELKKRGLYDEIWQAFSVLLPVRSVGVTGDAREYGYVLALRAIISRDGMTADVYPFESKDLLEISSLITNSVREIGRVVYDISSKPPATIEWE
ncbi:glutamine-hydrolyzing GMP synthase [Marispirochaeta aestuarii]|uniref:glutamine-hydrolyzing GMP synthase n=1 Tax=Marispirochaeta aestuarii TaxID=1963862 RepID=UPI002ABE4F31|nr:glutamine-hydrolyzing GMP synthase [Marispirochaeta aestuarii]